jgi:hypothetical protein
LHDATRPHLPRLARAFAMVDARWVGTVGSRWSGWSMEGGLVCLVWLLGLRIFEAPGANVSDLRDEHGQPGTEDARQGRQERPWSRRYPRRPGSTARRRADDRRVLFDANPGRDACLGRPARPAGAAGRGSLSTFGGAWSCPSDPRTAPLTVTGTNSRSRASRSAATAQPTNSRSTTGPADGGLVRAGPRLRPCPLRGRCGAAAGLGGPRHGPPALRCWRTTLASMPHRPALVA